MAEISDETLENAPIPYRKLAEPAFVALADPST
jgi:hypothetical protein